LPPPWINIDAQVVPVIEGKVCAPPDMVLDIQSGLWQLDDATYSWIYSSHVIEHLFPTLLPGVLRHLYRILVPGGVLTLATTDLMGIVEHRYLERDNGEFFKSALFGECDVHDHPMSAHRNVFDYKELVDLLGAAGFARMRPWEPGQYPEIFALNDYSRSARLVSVLIEGVKAP
jgi:predicted SAM-dependent methyltransferase